MSYNLRSDHEALSAIQIEYFNHYIALADAKASVGFGISAALVGYLATQPAVQYTLSGGTHVAGFWWVALALALSTLAGASALVVIIPRVWKSPEDGVVSWPSVSKFDSADAYLALLEKQDEPTLRNARAALVFDLSRVSAAKHRWVAITFFLTALAICASGYVLFLVPRPDVTTII